MKKELTARAKRAMEILKSGGYFRKALETQYRGGEKFVYRLRGASGQIVKGIGFQTWFEMSQACLLNSRPCARSSVWPEEWGLREA